MRETLIWTILANVDYWQRTCFPSLQGEDPDNKNIKYTLLFEEDLYVVSRFGPCEGSPYYTQVYKGKSLQRALQAATKDAKSWKEEIRLDMDAHYEMSEQDIRPFGDL